MKLNFSVKYLLAFIPLVFLMGETHELVHTSVGRLICGCWGVRDFNVWGLCGGCKENYPALSTLATFAGPIYSFILVWVGYFMLGKEKSDNSKAWGISLIAANILFARILTAGISGGDEVYGLRMLFDSRYVAWILGLAIVLILSIPPLVRVYKNIKNQKKILWFIGLLLIPFIIAMIGAMTLNPLLKNGFLDEVWVMGSPRIITYWLVFNLLAFLIFYRNIRLINKY